MRKLTIVCLMLPFVLFGCGRTWNYGGLRDYESQGPPGPPESCQPCHEAEFSSWKKTKHAKPEPMAGVKLEELRGCGACHENSLAHSQDPETITPSNPSSLDKASQNAVCGKCHYSQEILGRRAINPRDRHGLLTNAGFEGHSKLLSCLECHSPHAGHSKMLAGARAHVCFKCHKSAIVTMGVFQPFNYLTFGKACQACHTVHGGSPVSKAARMGVGVCVVCHFGGIAITGGEE